jgi:hypothetical protein
MGDRTFCSLKICGILTSAADHETLLKLLKKVEPYNQYKDLEKMEKGPLDLNIDFEEVNYGKMDDNLHDLLLRLNLSYIWNWSNGDDYISGTELYDARDGFSNTEYTVDGAYFVTMENFENQTKKDLIHEMVRREKEITSQHLYKFCSAHEVIEFTKTNPEMSPYLGEKKKTDIA